MKKTIFILLLVVGTCRITFAQEKQGTATKDTTVLAVLKQKPVANPEHRWGDAGFGIGLDYGGLPGVKATVYVIPYMGIFGAVGYDLFQIAWNVGALGRFIPADGTHGVRPYVKIMYGVNGATTVKGMTGYDKLFYGFTPGIGLETRFGKTKKSGLNFDLNFPLRSPEFFFQVNAMKNDPNLTNVTSPIPVAFSIGYQFEF